MIAEGGGEAEGLFPAHSQYFLLLSLFTLTRILFMNSMERQFTRTGLSSKFLLSVNDRVFERGFEGRTSVEGQLLEAVNS
jgi:hypothetical protein